MCILLWFIHYSVVVIHFIRFCNQNSFRLKEPIFCFKIIYSYLNGKYVWYCKIIFNLHDNLILIVVKEPIKTYRLVCNRSLIANSHWQSNVQKIWFGKGTREEIFGLMWWVSLKWSICSLRKAYISTVFHLSLVFTLSCASLTLDLRLGYVETVQGLALGQSSTSSSSTFVGLTWNESSEKA